MSIACLLFASGAGTFVVAEYPGSAGGFSASITEYGADPSGVRDSSPAFERMIAAIGTLRQIQPEDGIIRGSYFVGNVESIVLDINGNPKEWPEPGFHIDNCHVNYRDCGIRLKGVRQANISHTLFYCHDHTGTKWFKYETSIIPDGDETRRRDYEPHDVDIANSSDIILDGNIFTEPANPSRVGIRIGPDSGSILISGNQFNMGGTAIKNESSNPSYSSGNIFAGNPDWSADQKRYDDRLGTLAISDFNTGPRPVQTAK